MRSRQPRIRIDVQLSPAVVSWPRLLEGVLVAEQAGFDTFWAFDHFLGSMIGGDTMLEPFALLGALATATSRITLGSLVLNVANRSAAVIASGAATLQTLSSGRFVLGMGAGASPAGPWGLEHRVLGHQVAPTLAARHDRLVATLDELDRLWSPERSDELATFPRPELRPPVVLGVNSVALAEIAARRCDGMNVRATHDRLDTLISSAANVRAETGREGPWDVSVWAGWDERLLDGDHPDRRRWDVLGVSRLVLVCFERFDVDALRRAATALAS